MTVQAATQPMLSGRGRSWSWISMVAHRWHQNAARGALSRTDAYRDTYTEVDGVPLPAVRRVVTASDDGLVARQLRLSDLRILAGAGS